eukprot:331057-Amorphochlora_amoeboformis.AAC.1
MEEREERDKREREEREERERREIEKSGKDFCFNSFQTNSISPPSLPHIHSKTCHTFKRHIEPTNRAKKSRFAGNGNMATKPGVRKHPRLQIRGVGDAQRELARQAAIVRIDGIQKGSGDPRGFWISEISGNFYKTLRNLRKLQQRRSLYALLWEGTVIKGGNRKEGKGENGKLFGSSGAEY